jgi:hypothetical protein
MNGPSLMLKSMGIPIEKITEYVDKIPEFIEWLKQALVRGDNRVSAIENELALIRMQGERLEAMLYELAKKQAEGDDYVPTILESQCFAIEKR